MTKKRMAKKLKSMKRERNELRKEVAELRKFSLRFYLQACRFRDGGK